MSLEAIDYIAFYDKPFLKFERLLETYLAFAPRGFRSFRMAIPLWLSEKLFQRRLLRQELARHAPDVDWDTRLLFSEHHMSHAASAFYASPFDEAAVLTMDGVGEWATTSVAHGRGAALDMSREIHFPHFAWAPLLGVHLLHRLQGQLRRVQIDGTRPVWRAALSPVDPRPLIDLKPDGSFRLDQRYFDYCTGLTMTNDSFDTLFGGPARKPDELLTQRHMDLAASIQSVLEEAVLRLTRALAAETGSRNLCLAGGVALNCVANGRILRDRSFERIWIQPAAGDAGGALGAALAAWHRYLEKPRAATGGVDAMQGAYLGPSFSDQEIAARLGGCGARFVSLTEPELIARAALRPGGRQGARLVPGQDGIRPARARRTFDPGRSALAVDAEDAQPAHQVSRIVSSVRAGRAARGRRGLVRPRLRLAVHAARRRRGRWAAARDDRGRGSAVGIEKLNVPRSDIRPVTHVDYSARIQTVHKETNPRFHALLAQFKARTGCPVLVNTQLQRARRAHRRHAGGRLPLLHGQRPSRRSRSATACWPRTHRIPP